MKQVIFLLIIIILINSRLFAQFPTEARYLNARFENIDIEYDIIYGSAPALNFPWLNQNNTAMQNLLLDIYTPSGDSLNKRPAIIFAHSGGFVSGSRLNEDMIAFCDTFAHQGYVTVNLEYRMGMIGDDVSGTRAVYRGLQDSRAAIRFLKEFRDVYGIDTNNIYIAGSSAGSFVALQNYFMNEESERPELTFAGGSAPNNYPDLGCLDCTGNNYNHSGRAQAAIGLWGAISDTIIQKEGDGNNVLLVHGTDDAVVMFDVGPPWGYPSLPSAWGSLPMSRRLNNLGFEAETYFVEGEGHEFYNTSNGMWDPTPNAYWDTIVYKAKDFFYRQHQPEADFSYQKQYLTVDFEVETENIVWAFWDFGDQNTATGLNPQHTFAEAGSYNIRLIVQNNLGSRDTTEQSITVVEQVFVDSLKVVSSNGIYEITENHGTLQFTYNVWPDDASDTSVVWSLNPDDGTAFLNAFAQLQALKNGTVWVKAQTSDGSNISDSVLVEISGQRVLVEEIEVLSENGIYIIDEAGGQLQMIAEVWPQNATDTTVSWFINNTVGQAIADENGMVQAQINGLVYAVAEANDESKTRDSVAINIINQELEADDIGEIAEFQVKSNQTNIIIQGKGDFGFTVELYALSGRLIIQKSGNGQILIAKSNFPKGVYLLKVLSGQKAFYRKVLNY